MRTHSSLAATCNHFFSSHFPEQRCFFVNQRTLFDCDFFGVELCLSPRNLSKPTLATAPRSPPPRPLTLRQPGPSSLSASSASSRTWRRLATETGAPCGPCDKHPSQSECGPYCSRFPAQSCAPPLPG